MFHRTVTPSLTITDLGAPPPAAPRARLRLWERAVLALAAPAATAPVVACVTTGHAGPWAYGLAAAFLATLSIVVDVYARENKPVLPDPLPAWYIAWTESTATDAQPTRTSNAA